MSYKLQYLDQSALSTVRILHALVRSIHPRTTDQLAGGVDTPRHRAHQVLITLEHEGLVERDGGGWCVADGLFELVDPDWSEIPEIKEMVYDVT